MRRRRTFAVAALIVIVLGVTIAALGLGSPGATTSATTSSSTGASSTSTTPPTTPPQVVVSDLHQATFVDTCSTCSTENFVTGASTNGRTILTDIWYPSYGGNTPAAAAGTAPLILLAPGYDLSPLNYQPLIDSWVQAGYVVVSPVFPDTNPTAVAAVEKVYAVPGPHSPEADVANQPRDVAFVLARLVADERSSQGGNLAFLHGLFDPAEIGVAGQSDGGDTVAGLYFNSCCQTDSTVPVQAVAVLSGAEESALFTGSWFSADHTPLLVTQGTDDACNSPTNSDTLYNGAPVAAPKYFLELRGADHLVSYTADGPFLDDVARVSTDFFDLYLHHGSVTQAGLLASGRSSDSSLTDTNNAPALSAVSATWKYDPGTDLDPCSINFTGPPHAS